METHTGHKYIYLQEKQQAERTGSYLKTTNVD